MKKTLIIFLVLSIFVIAQEKPMKKNKVMDDVKECVDKIVYNKSAIKMLMKRIMNDENFRKEIHQELVDDPEIYKMWSHMREEHRHLMKNNKRGMKKNNMKMNESQQDTTNY